MSLFLDAEKTNIDPRKCKLSERLARLSQKARRNYPRVEPLYTA
jgi:hypothetical protein